MKATLMWVVLVGAVLLFGGTADAWGGLFNRFSPEMLANMGYGNHGGYHNFLQNEAYVEDEPIIENEPPCYARPCSTNEHCCPGYVCYNVDGDGYCVYAYGRKLGELCRRDADCEAGLVCDNIGGTGGSVCRAPIAIAKQYAEDCLSSSECDISRGLCCQLQRRHRQAPRKVCSYFKDPLTCIGTVAMHQIKHEVQHTAGEKRITSAYKHGLNGLNALN